MTLWGTCRLLSVFFFEIRQEAVPAFVPQGRIFCQLPFDHEFFDVVYRVDIGHAIFNDSPHFFQALVATHRTDSIPLHEYVGVRQEFERFKR